MKRSAGFVKIVSVFVVSVFLTGIFLWLLLSGKAKGIVNGIQSKIPSDNQIVNKIGEEILGTAKEILNSEDTKKVLGTGTKTGEKLVNEVISSEVVQQTREVVIQKINETVESIRQLPDQEVKRIKKEVCKQWLEEE